MQWTDRSECKHTKTLGRREILHQQRQKEEGWEDEEGEMGRDEDGGERRSQWKRRRRQLLVEPTCGKWQEKSLREVEQQWWRKA